ncbi:MAG TPA: hypothetical protein VNA30_02945 [Mycobacteriales bacterium]|nr:hypothetical protein [Mycobacteriales bacterium]
MAGVEHEIAAEPPVAGSEVDALLPHAGHADLLRESVDGPTGEDPPR